MEYVVPGLVNGSILLLGTVGFALIRRVEGFLNIAHAQLFIVGGFAAYAFNVIYGWPIVPAGLLGVAVAVLVGILTARLVYWPLRGEAHVVPLIASVGVSFVIFGVVEAMFGSGVRVFNIPVYQSIVIGGIRVGSLDQILIFGVAGVSVALIALWLSKTYSGRAIRAMAADPQLAEVRGIDTQRLLYLVWAVASGLAGLAGVLISISSRVYVGMGWDQILLIVVAAIIGGLGSIYGVMMAAVIVGLTASLTALVLPLAYGQAVVFAMVILVLYIRPEGLAKA